MTDKVSVTQVKVLFISYQFPPKSGPGVFRSMHFCRYLPEFGIEPLVLTVDAAEWEILGYKTDPELLKNIHPSVRVVSTPSFEPIRLRRLLMKLKIFRIFWFFLYPLFWEPARNWSKRNYKLAARIIKQEGISVVYTTSGPFASMMLGRKLQKRLGVQWVADLRDPFTDAYAWQFPSKLHWRIMRRVERKLFSRPEILIVNTPAVKELYLQRKYVPEDRIMVVNNGYGDD